MIKVFISHQKADAALATEISNRLRTKHQIDTYLDVIDTKDLKGEDLADYLRLEMGKCTQLLAVVSTATRESQWVPWEIGVATEKDFPLATYSGGPALPPEFLRKWPYLRTSADIDHYAAASRSADTTYSYRRSSLHESIETARSRSSKDFYRALRVSLGQS